MSEKKWRLRGYSVGITLLFLLLIVAVNVLAGIVQDRWALTVDLSANQFTEFSQETREILEDLDEPVHIHLLFQNKTQSELRINLEEILARYRTSSAFIDVDTIDPVSEPGRVNALLGQQATLAEGSMIVTNADQSRVRTIEAQTLFTAGKNGAGDNIILFNGESYLTSALMYVTSSDMPRVFFLTGHGEVSMSYCQTVVDRLSTQNYRVSELTLGQEALVPGDLVIVLCAEKDLVESEYEALRDWMQSGGRLLYVNDPSIPLENLPRFVGLLSYFQVAFEDGIVVEDEGETTAYLSSQTNLIPTLSEDSNITGPMAGKRVLLPKPGAVRLPEVQVSGFTVQPLLTSSKKAFLKPMDSDSALTERTGGEREGAFPLAMSVISQPDFYDKSKDIRLVAINSIATIADSQYLNASDNAQFTVNAVNWLVNRQEGAVPAARTMAAMTLALPNERALWWSAAIAVLPVPLILTAVGIAVWIVRRRR